MTMKKIKYTDNLNELYTKFIFINLGLKLNVYKIKLCKISQMNYV